MNAKINTVIGTSQILVTDNSASRFVSPRETRSFLAEAGKRITCTGGWLWLTEDGQGLDRILKSEMSFQLDRPARIVLSAPEGGSWRVD